MQGTRQKKGKKPFIDIESVIQQRLTLQTNQRILQDRFGIKEPSLDYFKSDNFLNRFFDYWPEKIQDEFLEILGGTGRYKRATRSFLSKLRNKEKEKETKAA